MATVRQLQQQINALLIPTSSDHPAHDHFLTNTKLYVRPSGSTWTRFNRPGPISHDFLPGETVIPCASLKHGTILRVIPYFISRSEENKNDSEEEDNASKNEHKEDHWYYNHKSDEESNTYHFYNEHGTSDSTSSNSDSDNTIHQQAYIRPEYGESNAE